MPQQYTETLQDVIGRLRSVRPGLPPTVARDLINDRIRNAIDQYPCWSGLYRESTITIPNRYDTGTIELTQGSKVITGTDTVWPVNDLVNTTIPDGVPQTGMQSVTPASMVGITEDSVLYIDAGGTPEVVAVVSLNQNSFVANFNYVHDPNCTATRSSFSGRQLRIAYAKPIYNILAVHSNTELEVDMAWDLTTASGQAYWITQMYYTIAPDIKDIVSVLDPLQGISLPIHVSGDMLNARDPQRSAIGTPICLADYVPNFQGNMQYEVWPIPLTERVLRVFFFVQWKRLTAPGDRLPYFINPSIIYHGALADAMLLKFGNDDSGQNLPAANKYELMYQKELAQAILADNSKMQQMYSFDYKEISFGGADWRRSHSASVFDY